MMFDANQTMLNTYNKIKTQSKESTRKSAS